MTTLKIAVFAAMPIAIVRMAIAEKAGVLVSVRIACRISVSMPQSWRFWVQGARFKVWFTMNLP